MNASKLFTAIAAALIASANPAFATELPVASASAATAANSAAVATTAAAAAPAAAAKPAATPRADREKIKAEAIEAASNRRATEASQFDWFMK